LQKTVIIFLGLIIAAGCSVKRKASSTARYSNLENSALVKISDVTELNYTARPFFIQRADITIISDNESQRATATIKFAQPDSFLISVRVLGGLVEAARILLTSDTIFINDRINSTLYFGSNENVKKKYGFDLKFFPVLLGDLITATNLPGINCNDGNAVLREFGKDYIINYFIDCKTGKCKEVKIESEFMKDYISLEFDDFGTDGKMIFPKHLKTNNFANFARLEIEIKRVEFNENSGIEFIPGRNYTQVEIK
jgi:hypothetical protein